ncbi:MAG: alpha/beta hydrolase [Ahniella sp.]|nr:alpha/beta hydrolase [Ahniella sp.]
MNVISRLFAICSLVAIGASAQAQVALPSVNPLYQVSVDVAVRYGQGQITSPTPGSKNLLLDLYRPIGASASGETSPVLVIIHGGGFRGGSRTEANLATIARAMAARGFVVASIDYRLDGEQPQPSPRVANILQAATAGVTAIDLPQRVAAVAAIDDALTAVDWLRANASQYNIDPTRIGLLGGSAGAITAVHLGYILDDYGVEAAPFSFVIDLWGGSIIPGNDPVAAANHVESSEPPLFVVHGTSDTVVPVALSELLTARAAEQGVPYEYYPIAGGGHGFGSINLVTLQASPGVSLFDRMVEWAVRTVRGQRTVSINYGMVGAWINPQIEGQGFVVDIDPVTGLMIVTWFVFDTASGATGGAIPGAEQRWFIAQGQYLGNHVELTVYQARFGQLNRATPVSTTPVGTMTIEFSDCVNANLSYDLSAFGLSGNTAITRLMPDVLCQSIADGSLQVPIRAQSSGNEN